MSRFKCYCKMLFVALYTQQCVIAAEKTGWDILCLYWHLQDVKEDKSCNE